jgi:hypothetical protein
MHDAATFVDRDLPASRKRARRLVLVVLVFLLLASAGFATTELTRPNPRPTSTRGQWQPYVDAATAYVKTMYDITPATASNSVQRMLDTSVGKLHAMLVDSAEKLTGIYQSSQSTCTISGAGVEDLSGDNASVLITAKVETPATGGQDPGTKAQPYRLRLNVQAVVVVAAVGLLDRSSAELLVFMNQTVTDFQQPNAGLQRFSITRVYAAHRQ